MRKLTKKIVCGVAAVAIMSGVFVGHTMLNKAAENEVSESSNGAVMTLREYYKDCDCRIGDTYNMVSGSGGESIFDVENEDYLDTKIQISSVDKIKCEQIKGTDIKELYDKKMKSLENDDAASNIYMPRWLDNLECEEYDYIFYSEHMYKYVNSNIKWLASEKDYYKFLSERFKDHLMTMKPKELIKKYGTHIETEVETGAMRLDKFKLLSNDKKQCEEFNNLQITKNHNREYKEYANKKGISNNSNSVNIFADITYINSENMFDDERIIAVGKANPWHISTNKNSLKPIWTLLDGVKDSSYTDEQINNRKNELEEAYKYYVEEAKEICMEYLS